MKKFLTLCCLLSVSILAFAQSNNLRFNSPYTSNNRSVILPADRIPSDFLGCTLGITTEVDALKNFNRLGIQCDPSTAGASEVLSIRGDIECEGAKFMGVSFWFYNNIFWKIVFYNMKIDANILEEIGSNYCIVGHSERRQLGETNENINQKIKNLSSTNIKPILCVGEKKEDYDNKNTIKEIKEQVLSALKDIEQLNNLYIAYEPIWAIGTGKTPTKEEIENVMENIIKNANSVCNIKELKVFYGGSVNKENIEEILNYNYIDGVLVGNFSRNIDDFFDTIEEINIK